MDEIPIRFAQLTLLLVLFLVRVPCRCPAHRSRARDLGRGGCGAEGREGDPGRVAGLQGSGAGHPRGTFIHPFIAGHTHAELQGDVHL